MRNFTRWTLLAALVFASATVGTAQQSAGSQSSAQSSDGTAQQPTARPESKQRESQTGSERKTATTGRSSKAEEKEQLGVRCTRLKKN